MPATPGATRISPNEGALLLEVMMLMTTADGVVHADEIEELTALVEELKIFSGYRQSEVKQLLSGAHAMLQQQGLGARLSAIRSGLSTRRLRLLAFALAVRISLADGKVVPQEISVLRDLEKAFGLQLADVGRLMKGVRGGESIESLVEELSSTRPVRRGLPGRPGRS